MERLCQEVWPLVRMWYFAQRAKSLPQDEELAFCYGILNKVSRSFAVVIQQLPKELRDSVCIFYLVLRALDTVEDDMAIPVSVKVPVLRSFSKYIYQRDWKMECGEKEYAILMARYPTVITAFLRLSKPHQEVIADITKRMGAGMAEFIEAEEVATIQQYDLYCHYVAGLVGIGLSQLFASSGLESRSLVQNETLSNGMGLFLQKTNIIRDYLEDIEELPRPRMFWPREVWGPYASDLAEFKDAQNTHKAVSALNDLVADALRHAVQSLEYMAKLHNQDILRFCAIPQVMAIATLAIIYNNPQVFKGVVKVRRGVVARYMVGIRTISDVYRAFLHFAQDLERRCTVEVVAGEHQERMLSQLRAISTCCSKALQEHQEPLQRGPQWSKILLSWTAILFSAAVCVEYTWSKHAIFKIVEILFLVPVTLLAFILVYSISLRI